MTPATKSPNLFPMCRDFHHKCGPYQLQAVLRAFGHDAAIENLYYSEADRARDWSLPWNMPKILARYGVLAKLGFWLAPSFAERLAASIDADRPTLFVANSIQGAGNLHWLSAWGHTRAEDGARDFLVYDSQMPTSTEPFGNARYHESLLTRQLPWLGTFAVTIHS